MTAEKEGCFICVQRQQHRGQQHRGSAGGEASHLDFLVSIKTAVWGLAIKVAWRREHSGHAFLLESGVVGSEERVR